MRSPFLLLWVTTTTLKQQSRFSAAAFPGSKRSCAFRPISLRSVPWNFQMSSRRVASTTATKHADTMLVEDPNFFLNQVETTIQNVLNDQTNATNKDILSLPQHQREAVGIAKHLQQRLQSLRRNNDCPRCWMQRAHCICSQCPPVHLHPQNSQHQLGRIFLLVHHKEVGMKIDTAKLILAAFPRQCRLVVAGIGPEYQSSMRELQDAISDNSNCLVLFPDETAQTFSEILATTKEKPTTTSQHTTASQHTTDTTTSTTDASLM